MITLITRDGCINCVKAKEELDKRKLKYEIKNIPDDISREKVIDIYPEAKGLPVFILDGKYSGSIQELIAYLTVPSPKNLLGMLYENNCVIGFEKNDGTYREMKCTTNLSRIPPDKWPKDVSKTPDVHSQFRVWDIEKQDWRSFNYNQVLSVNTV